jgi:hypothetical protein
VAGQDAAAGRPCRARHGLSLPRPYKGIRAPLRALSRRRPAANRARRALPEPTSLRSAGG